MATLIKILNRVLPFATPGTPLLQDLVHLAAVCALLYFGPQLQEQFRRHRAGHAGNDDIPNGPHEVVAGEEAVAVPADLADHAVPPAADVDEGSDNDNSGHSDNDAQDNPAAQIAEGQPGPAQNLDVPVARDLGAKKAKSIARRDQRRAYHEFQRSQGEAQRARDAEGAAEREAASAAGRERRRLVEAAIEAKKVKEREERREREKREREAEMRRRDLAVELVTEALQERRMCDLWQVAEVVGGDADADWVERLLKGTSIPGRKGSVITVVTQKGWMVQIGEEDMGKVYEMALQRDAQPGDGRISYDVLGKLLEEVLRAGGS